ncbi:MAG: VanZ family protein [candidate division Zixibacteria bacterium]|nr:VanZ family protein [candidate division Zixibacteria bacterium]
MSFIFILSSGSIPDLRIPFPHSDKVAHFTVFGVLSFLLGRAAGWSWGWSWFRVACFAVVVTSLYGITDEWHQSHVKGRSVEVADWMADTLGAVFAQVMLFCVYKRKIRT